MKTKTYLLLLALLAILRVGNAQNTGAIKVTVIDSATKEGVPFANAILYKSKVQMQTATTDVDGNAYFKQLAADKYSVKVAYVGYATKEIKNITVTPNKTTYIQMPLSNSSGVHLDEVMIMEYKTPMVDANTVSGSTIIRESYQNMAAKDVTNVISNQAGVVLINNGSSKQIRGARGGIKKVVADGEGYNYSDNKAKSKAYDKVNEEYGSYKESTFNPARNQPLSTFAIDVDGASYSNARRVLQQGVLPQKDAVRVEEFINYFPYNYPQPKDDKPFSISTEYAACPWDKNHNLLQIGIKGKEIDAATSPASHLVFLIDVSGSMEDENKLPLLKRAFKLLVKQLRPKDRLSIVVYAGSSGMIIENASGDEKEQINQALDVLTAGGSTAGGDGINLAYKIAEQHFIKEGNNRVILATDGDFNVGLSSQKELEDLIVEKRNNGIYLSVLGFGEGNLKDSKMETLADKGNGNYYYIDNFTEARKVLVSQFGGTLYTIAKDVKIQIEFNPAFVKEYRLIGYDNRLLAAEDFNDDKKDAGELGSGHCVTALYEIIPAGSAESHAKIDELKYSKPTTESTNSTEMATVKFRYKNVKKTDTTSKLITQPIANQLQTADATSSNFKLAAGVTEFALLLRESEYKGASSFKQAIDLVNQSKAADPNGYIAGLLEMIKISSDLTDTKVSKK
ncbi:MAG TPA: von Willebrand factor type A domain-containing protein [Bacteroidia bacterium]|jgi:Ca-activated chloride channel family protein|nr:von Willebrand factor type A domain-containing protein [Bacteroidia bacterium]